MGSTPDLLRQVMSDTGTSQSELSRLSGVHQPSISQFLSGKIDFSDQLLDRLLACMGYRLEVTIRAEPANLTRSEWRSWRVHRQLATLLNTSTLQEWRPSILSNIDRLRQSVYGEPHLRHLSHWEQLTNDGDLQSLKRALTGLDRQSIEMREVTPMSGLLPDTQRRAALQAAH
ncbi:hypothetical protein MCHIJ_06380 [Mycolicibacterium chitae]|uniref:Helix-turn-helix domain-containing protein n=1 Tax=Mycolicibacterium chitae TaxID=1792 RepID=A0A448IC78_MYCCI|nr:helix-turn-helix transcriptional regulator [Mycolicibacterium chitae]BBZ01201.1 hypothetical protein MCHIJ_06380 [Mycolicibacterium chitae]VEG50038.1 helix-turn-helix domain-containing protein [Mycolicibacterium chitae]